MSDFLFSSRPREPGVLRAALERYLAHVSAEIREHHGAWGSLAVARGSHDDEPVVERDGTLSVLIGNPVVSRTDGVTEPRLVVHEELAAGGIAWDRRLDGHFALLSVDLATGDVRVATDRFAFIPVFVARGDAVTLGTHVDAVAVAAGRSGDLDPVSAADLAVHLSCTFPHTLYVGVEQLFPASEHTLAAGRLTSAEPYWLPREGNPFASLADAADALREGVVADVRAACAGHPEVGLLLSGGEDSRAVLAAVGRESRVRAFTYADWESREVRVTRTVAQVYGAELVVGWRGKDHYLDGCAAVSAMVGTQHLFLDVHGYGFHDRLGIRDLPVVLGGFSSDVFLKARYGVAAGRRAPGLVTDPAIRPELLAAVAERRAVHRERVRELRPTSTDEWVSLWPYSQRRHGSNVHGNRRLFRSHEVFHGNAVLDIAAAVPREWKVRRRLFHQAMQPLFAPSRWVPHSEYRFPYFGWPAHLALVPGLAIARGASAVVRRQLRARHRSWPRWTSLTGSAAMRRIQGEHPLAASPLREIFVPRGDAELERTVEGWYSLRRLMVLQLAYLLDGA